MQWRGLHQFARAAKAARFCTYVTQSIIMVNMTEDIDPTIFWDINGIEGSVALINCNNVTSIDGVLHLKSIGLLPTSWTNGHDVSLYVE